MLQSRLLPANHATTHAKRQSVVTRAADSNWPAGKHPLPPLLQGSAAVQPMPVSCSHMHIVVVSCHDSMLTAQLLLMGIAWPLNYSPHPNLVRVFCAW